MSTLPAGAAGAEGAAPGSTLVLRRFPDADVVSARVRPASSFLARFRGLMGRASLDPDEGLYLRDTSIHMFFMRFPIDACFVSRPDGSGRRRVVDARHELPPWRGLVLPVRGAEGVVELPAGTLRRHGIERDTVVTLEPATP